MEQTVVYFANGTDIYKFKAKDSEIKHIHYAQETYQKIDQMMI